MADRMTATRQALALLHLDEDEQDAALAEVEEWETRADTLEAALTVYAERTNDYAVARAALADAGGAADSKEGT